MRLSPLGIAISLAMFMIAGPAWAECPKIEATKLRKAISHASISKAVTKQYDGNWSAYIAKWERQIDTARDVFSRKKGLVVRVGGARKVLKGKTLIAHIESLGKRVDVAYCLKDEMMSQADANAAGDPSRLRPGSARAGRKIAELTDCLSCHGEKGIAEDPTTPDLAGQDEKYLRNQLRTYDAESRISSSVTGAGSRRHKDMVGEARVLNENSIADLALYYAELPCGPEAGGQKTAGEPPQKAQICSACHGLAGRAQRVGMPKLAGQKAAYIAGQLRAFRMTTGNPRSFLFDNRRYHQIMSAIAGPLSNRDMTEIAGYFAAQSCR